MKRLAVGLIIGLALAACTPQQSGPGAAAAKARHEKFETLGKAFKALNEEVKKGAPDGAVMAAQADKIAAAAAELPTWFAAGSGPQDGVKSDALAAVWTEPAKFDAKAVEFQTKAAALKAASALGPEAMKPLIAPLGASCKGCHQDFKKK